MKPVFDIAEKVKNSPNGLSVKRLVSAAATVNPTVVKASGGRVYKITGENAAAAVKYIKLYNKATAPAATDTPVATFAVAASAPFSIEFDAGLYFSAGIGYRLTGANADDDATALTAADILALNVFYC
mgnify:FL=1